MKESTRYRKRNRLYGVQVRLHTGEWAWVKPNTQLTRKPVEAAHWKGSDAQESALEAARTLSVRLPQLTFRVARL
jgi:hypothetical protein